MPRGRPKKLVNKLTLDVTPRCKETLMRLAGSENNFALIVSHALTLYDLALSATMNGEKVVLKGEETEREVVLIH